MIEIAIWFVAINWGGTLLFWLYPLVMWLIFKDFVFEGFYGPFAKFRLVNKGEIDDPIEPWHARAWSDWWGVCLHWYICYRDRPGKFDDALVARGLVHEGTHGWQQLALGLLFWVAYKGHMLWILVTQKIRHWWLKRKMHPEGAEQPPDNVRYYTKHAYLDCWAERMARGRAGQLVDVPPYQWPQGPADLLPFW
jgi:hypothetical protein